MEHDESLLRDLLRLIVWYPVRWMLLVLPIPWCLVILRWMGDIHHAVVPRKRKRLSENLKNILRKPDRFWAEGQIREYFRNHYVDRLSIFLFPRFSRGLVDRLVDFKGLEHLDGALEIGKGVILVHGHIGPVHLPLVALSHVGYPMKQIGLPDDEGLSRIGKQVAFRLRLAYEAKIPAEIIQADSYFRPVFRWLHQNGIVMITGDGAGGQRRVGRHRILSFCGNPVWFPLGPYRLAEKTGASILPLFLLPGRTKPFTVIIEPRLPMEFPPEIRPEKWMEFFAGRLEEYVTRFPGWMHFLDRFQEGRLIVPRSIPAVSIRGDKTPLTCNTQENPEHLWDR